MNKKVVVYANFEEKKLKLRKVCFEISIVLSGLISNNYIFMKYTVQILIIVTALSL